jgi:hypothetical protein
MNESLMKACFPKECLDEIWSRVYRQDAEKMFDEWPEQACHAFISSTPDRWKHKKPDVLILIAI